MSSQHTNICTTCFGDQNSGISAIRHHAFFLFCFLNYFNSLINIYFWLHRATCRILIPPLPQHTHVEPTLPALEAVLTTETPRKSLLPFYKKILLPFYLKIQLVNYHCSCPSPQCRIQRGALPRAPVPLSSSLPPFPEQIHPSVWKQQFPCHSREHVNCNRLEGEFSA